VVQDKLLVRVGGQYQKQDGYQHVITQNLDLLNQNYWNWRGSATFTPTDDIQNEFMLNYFDTVYRPGAFTYAGFNPAAPAAFPLPFQQLLKYAQLGFIGPLAKQYLAGVDINLAQLYQQQQQLGLYNIEALSVPNPIAVLRQLNIVDTATWDITDSLTLKNIAGYQEITSYGKSDIAGLQLGVLNGPTPLANGIPGPTVQYNEELQILGNFFDGKLRTVFGVFNQWGGSAQGGTSDTRAPHAITYTDDFGGVSIAGATQTSISNTHAVYTQEDLDLSDFVEGLKFTAGFRYTWDKFYTQGNAYNPYGVYVIPTCIIDGASVQSPKCPTSQNARFRAPSYTFQLSYQWTPDVMFYINNSLGYKTGGFNGQNFVGPFAIYQPEHLNNYEAGIKSSFDFGFIGMDSVKALVDGSLYYGVYRDIEIQTTGAYLNTSNQLALGTPYLDVGGGDLYGWDLQFTVLPTADITLKAYAEYNKGKYKNFQAPNQVALPGFPIGTTQVSEPGVAFEILPEYKANGSITYDFSFIDKSYGDVSLTGAYSWVQHSVNTDVAKVTYYDLLAGHHNIDMSLDWQDILGHTGVSGRVWVTNLTNNSRTNGCLCAYYVVGEIGYQPAQPRMWGVTAKYEFGPNSFGGAAAPAAYTPPPVVAPAPAPVARSYMVFFDFNKSDLSPEAVTIVDQAAKNASPAKTTTLTVTGHTDTVGSDAYNMRLSQRRAESVAAELERNGIPSSEIALVAKGKRDLLVPTKDGVREPQNRRVTIVYDGGPTS
jgi:outer membrane protein OmpA-like peptidoglycan-associated protein